MNDYRFETRWLFNTPLDRVWEILRAPEGWPAWWPGLARAECIERGGNDGVDSVYRFTLRAPLGYSLSFTSRVTEVVPGQRIAARAEGDLDGGGTWTVQATDGATLVNFLWEVRTSRAWMNVPAPLLRPAFVVCHAWAMDRAGRGLARELGSQLRRPTAFRPDRVAMLETAGWRAYETRNWPRLALAVTRLNAEGFHIPFPQSVLAAYYSARASAAWVPAEHDTGKVLKALTNYYRLARQYSGLEYDPERAARLELRYWEEHRRLVGQPDKTPFVEALTDLHAELFRIPPEPARRSAELRVEANNVLDSLVHGESTEPGADWTRIGALLQECYRCIDRAMDRTSNPSVVLT